MTSGLPVSGVIVYLLRVDPDQTRVLFLKRSGGLFEDAWWPVGGTPQSGESPFVTAQREVLEETGLQPTDWQPFGIDIPHADGTSVMRTWVAFVSADDQIVLNYEHSDYQWMTIAEILDYVPAGSEKFIHHLDEHFCTAGE